MCGTLFQNKCNVRHHMICAHIVNVMYVETILTLRWLRLEWWTKICWRSGVVQSPKSPQTCPNIWFYHDSTYDKRPCRHHPNKIAQQTQLRLLEPLDWNPKRFKDWISKWRSKNLYLLVRIQRSCIGGSRTFAVGRHLWICFENNSLSSFVKAPQPATVVVYQLLLSCPLALASWSLRAVKTWLDKWSIVIKLSLPPK